MTFVSVLLSRSLSDYNWHRTKGQCADVVDIGSESRAEASGGLGLQSRVAAIDPTWSGSYEGAPVSNSGGEGAD